MNSSYQALAPNLPSIIRGTAKFLNASSAKYSGDWFSFPHTHDHMELFYIVGGKGHFLIEGVLHPVTAGDLVIINPDTLHTEVSLNAQPLEYIVLGIGGIQMADSTAGGEQFNILDHFESVEVSSCLRNILREMELKNFGYEDICQAYTEILIIRLMRMVELNVPTSSHLGSGNRRCATVRRYIDLHFKEPLTLEHLAEIAHMNKFYLSHSFKQEYGISPINYMINKRIEESKYLLAETDLSMSQIAQMLGFSSLSYFSQVFRKTQSRTPLEYRKSTRRL
ncbi:MAG: AraC family transcriptional regulator [Oscillospiraceae bacterium]|nr:AraC family transcriptional regulator [Oscillospiraceae bacterium]